jgi:hypothetical protein
VTSDQPHPTAWRRQDGALRVLVHLDGPPAPEEAETRGERLCLWLDGRLPGWDDAVGLVAVGLLVLVVGIVAALARP